MGFAGTRFKCEPDPGDIGFHLALVGAGALGCRQINKQGEFIRYRDPGYAGVHDIRLMGMGPGIGFSKNEVTVRCSSNVFTGK